MNSSSNLQIYQTFGVEDLADELQAENDHEKLEELNQTLYKYIVLRTIDELPEDAVKNMEEQEFEDGEDLYRFFSGQIDDFSKKLEAYGREFQRTYNFAE